MGLTHCPGGLQHSAGPRPDPEVSDFKKFMVQGWGLGYAMVFGWRQEPGSRRVPHIPLSLYTYMQLTHSPFASSVLYREENNFKNDAPEGMFPCLSGLGSCDLC